MELSALANSIGAELRGTVESRNIDLDQVYAGDRISDLLNAAGDHALLVSNLASGQLIRVAQLMDIPCICLVSGQEPDDAMLAAASEHETALMVSPFSLFETCGRIHASLAVECRRQ